MKIPGPSSIVGTGGSAGGLNAYKALLDALPPDTGLAFVIIAHLYPTANSQLAAILSRRTEMPVRVAATATPIRRNQVYVIPPNSDLLIENLALKVVSPRSARNVQVDLFFASLADALRARAIGIVLSGYDGDGTEGCRAIKAKGGTTFAQDMSAEVNLMPRDAQASEASTSFCHPTSDEHRVGGHRERPNRRSLQPGVFVRARITPRGYPPYMEGSA